jgi:hypothetical protein
MLSGTEAFRMTSARTRHFKHSEESVFASIPASVATQKFAKQFDRHSGQAGDS